MTLANRYRTGAVAVRGPVLALSLGLSQLHHRRAFVPRRSRQVVRAELRVRVPRARAPPAAPQPKGRGAAPGPRLGLAFRVRGHLGGADRIRASVLGRRQPTGQAPGYGLPEARGWCRLRRRRCGWLIRDPRAAAAREGLSSARVAVPLFWTPSSATDFYEARNT